MSKLNTYLRKTKAHILEKIDTTEKSGQVAPEGAKIASYCVTRNGAQYWYWKLAANSPIFVNEHGEKIKTVHLGTLESPMYQEAEEMIRRRSKISLYKKVLKKIEEIEKLIDENRHFKL